MAVFSTFVSCVVSVTIACSLTILFVRKSSLWMDEQCTFCQCGQPHLRTIADGRIGREQTKTVQKSDGTEVVLLQDAAKEGAVCLDGSAPGYHFKKGFGTGVNNWVIYLNGGAWCSDEQACYERSKSRYGSTQYTQYFPNQGMYSTKRNANPDFYNWNMAFVIYCDGSSFTGMRREPVYFAGKPVYFRGKFILDAIFQDLVNRGLGNAREVFLTGSSAGSLAVLIHADYIKSRLPAMVRLRALSDSGYFVDLKTQHGFRKVREMFRSVLLTHNSTFGLHKSCIERTHNADHWKCFFPQYFFSLIQTPVFVLQAAYDSWQLINYLEVICKIADYHDLEMFRSSPPYTLRNTLAGHARSLRETHEDLNRHLAGRHLVESSHKSELRTTRKESVRNDLHAIDKNASKYKRGAHERSHNQDEKHSNSSNDCPHEDFKKVFARDWQGLYNYLVPCTKSETEAILGLRNISLAALEVVLRKTGSGLFFTPCFGHSQASFSRIWAEMKIQGKTMREAIHGWYFEETGKHHYVGGEFSFATCIPCGTTT